ncbi:MAG: thiosulfate oxidation carrier complex protein SoxZ [bacterium]
MAGKIFRNPRIRVPRRIKKDQLIEVRVKVGHNSYTGLKIVDGKYFTAQPAYFLTNMKIFYGDDLVSEYEMTSATSPNPLIRFKLRATKEAPLRVVMVNSDNVRKEGKTRVKFS